MTDSKLVAVQTSGSLFLKSTQVRTTSISMTSRNLRTPELKSWLTQK